MEFDQQTLTTAPSAESDGDASDTDNARESSGLGPFITTTIDEENVTVHSCEDEINTWLAEMEAADKNYGYIALEIATKQTLEGTKIGTTTTLEINGTANSKTRIGGGGNLDGLVYDLFVEAISLVATPYVEGEAAKSRSARSIPKEHIRIFIPDIATRLFDISASELEDLYEQFNAMPEYEADDELERLYRKHHQMARGGVVQEQLEFVDAQKLSAWVYYTVVQKLNNNGTSRTRNRLGTAHHRHDRRRIR